jgi:hypothetical protein
MKLGVKYIPDVHDDWHTDDIEVAGRRSEA